jgi:drug/metabolite transporter (DMT)-like permease
MISVMLAVLTALANAGASVLQRKAGRSTQSDEQDALRVMLHQLRSKVWFGGISLMVLAFVLQAAALSTGSLAVVQPVLAGELPLTLLLAARLFHRRMGGRDWLASVGMAVALGVAVVAAAPSGGTESAPPGRWLICAPVVVGLIALTLLGHRESGAQRAALLGAVAGGLFGLTATIMTAVTVQARSGLAPLFGTGYIYALAVCGAAAVVILQQAYAAGSLAAAQPGVTLVDPVVAVLLGVALFDVKLRTGWFAPLEVAAVAVIIVCALRLARSPLVNDVRDDQSPPARQADLGSTSAQAAGGSDGSR